VNEAESFQARYPLRQRDTIESYPDVNEEDELLVSKQAFEDGDIQVFCQSRFVECLDAGLSPWQTVHQIKTKLDIRDLEQDDFC
jgi:hypothetical protein